MQYLSLVFLQFIVITDASLDKTDKRSNEDLSAGDDRPEENRGTLRDELASLQTRRIMRGHLVRDTRPYMVYLRPAVDDRTRVLFDTSWTCGGVIIDKRFILTSAACIEDARNFYVVSGTHKFIPPFITDNECVVNGAKKAVWKCIPKSYYFDGDAFDNIRWMVGDIAIVKVEDDFNFERRIKGCDFVPQKIGYNNITEKLSKSGTIASVAGWGTEKRFVNLASASLRSNFTEKAENSAELLESDVIIISTKGCKKHWDERYHFIIQNEMICTKDSTNNEPIGNECLEHGVDCKEVGQSDEDYYQEEGMRFLRRRMPDRQNLIVHTAAHGGPYRRSRLASGGFCENDHGGPLIFGQGRSAVVIGIMSACLTHEINHRCYGPFLFTSVYKYRNLIACAIDNSLRYDCRRLLKSTNTQLKKETFNWRGRYSVLSHSAEMEAHDLKARERTNNQVPSNLNKHPLYNNQWNFTKGTTIGQEKHDKVHLRANYENSTTKSYGNTTVSHANTTDSHGSTPDYLRDIKNVILRRFYN